MLKSKYVFETQDTKKRRLTKVFLNTLVVLFIFYTVFCVIFVLESKHKNKKTNEALFNRRPDLIVVFTGDAGRIPYALKLAEKYNQPNVFISGVYEKNTVDSLMPKFKSNFKNIDFNFLKIDYLAKNTVENVIFTMRFLRENSGFKRILIISNDYHITRVNLINSRFQTKEDDFEFHYFGIETDYTNFRNIKILYKEVFKLIRAYLFLIMWNY